jgi:hypothetical protein
MVSLTRNPVLVSDSCTNSSCLLLPLLLLPLLLLLLLVTPSDTPLLPSLAPPAPAAAAAVALLASMLRTKEEADCRGLTVDWVKSKGLASIMPDSASTSHTSVLPRSRPWSAGSRNLTWG